MKRWRPGLGLAALLAAAACVFHPDLSRFPPCDAQGACPSGWTCLASEGVCLPDCGERGPCTAEVPPDTDGGDTSTPDAGPSRLVLVPDGPGDGLETASYFHRFQASGGTPPYTFSTPPEALPPGLTLAANGELSGKPTSAGDFRFTVEVVDQGPEPQHSSQELSVHIRPRLRLAGPGILAKVELGTAYVEQLSATGGKSPYKFELVPGPGGTLPAGIVLRNTGRLEGTSNEMDVTRAFDVRVTDSDEPPQVVTGTLQLTTGSCGLLSLCLRTSAVPDARVGTAYTYTLQSTPASATWSTDPGKLPPGLGLDGATGILSGTPTKAGTYGFTVTASSGLASKTLPLTLEVY